MTRFLKQLPPAAGWWLSILLVIVISPSAHAKRTSPLRAVADPSAAVLRAAGLRHLQDGEIAEATRSFEAAYRLLSDGEGLYLLSRVADFEGRTRAAKDLARRYLAEDDPPSPMHADWRTAAQRILSLPEDRAGELAVLGPAGAFVLFDDRLVGRLPLSRPLWASPGAHRVVVETNPAREKPQSFTTQVELPPDRTLELRVQAETGVVLITRVPSLVVLLARSAIAPESESHFLEAIVAAARREHLAIATPQPSGDLDVSRSDDTQSLDWLDALAQRAEAAYVLDARVAGPELPSGSDANAWSLRLRLISGPTGDVVSTRQLTCPGCSTERMSALLEQELAEALDLAQKRPYGELIVNSEPPSAEVFCDGRRVGVTPYRRIVWTGDRQLELRRAGYTAWSRSVQIDESKPTSLSIKLQPEPQAAPNPPAPQLVPVHKISSPAATAARPRYRLILGGLSIATGIVLAGFGASALAVNGHCSPDTPDTALDCRRSYDAAPIGGALLGVGGAFMAAGGALLLIPGSRSRKAERRTTLP